MAVIAREGVDGATTRRIAEEAGAPLATLHYAFQTKENLLWAVFEELGEQLRADFASVEQPGQDLAGEARQLLLSTVGWGLRNRDHSRAQIEIWLWAERNDAALAARAYEKFVSEWKAVFRGARATIADDAELESFARVFTAIIDGLTMQMMTEPDPEAVSRRAEMAADMIEAYLRRRKRKA
ncbi:MAG: TetR/AcrR family transcriptional regulator [Nocardioides sp.]|uniref:TetR/AcrR family transcriptional regulator n=1 Tax=Nocardioides sp. TaxID=35761 RepID=UPI0039E43748